MAFAYAVLAAICGGISATTLAAASRRFGVRPTAAMSGAVGILVGPATAVIAHGWPRGNGGDWAWAAAAGALSLAGNGLFLAAARRTALAVVTPIVASAGGLAAAMAAIVDTQLEAPTVASGIVITAGVVLAARSQRSEAGTRTSTTGVVLAAASAIMLAASYRAIAHTEDRIGAGWAYTCLMVLMVLVWTLPALRSRQLWLDAASLKLILIAELAGAAVFLSYGRAARSDAVVAAVVYGMYALVAALIGLVLWRERPSRLACLGAATALLGSIALLLSGVE